jgi:hypothetical protein
MTDKLTEAVSALDKWLKKFGSAFDDADDTLIGIKAGHLRTISRALQGWQSIETAPRDADGAYLFITAAGVQRVDCIAAEQDSNTNIRWKERPMDRYTHWQPLPPPPEKSE